MAFPKSKVLSQKDLQTEAIIESFPSKACCNLHILSFLITVLMELHIYQISSPRTADAILHSAAKGLLLGD